MVLYIIYIADYSESGILENFGKFWKILENSGKSDFMSALRANCLIFRIYV